MTSAEIIAKIRAERDRLTQIGITALWLFGSRSKELHRPDSDLDVFIEYDQTRKFSIFDLLEVRFSLEDLLGLEVDLLTRKGILEEMRDEIEGSAIQVF